MPIIYKKLKVNGLLIMSFRSLYFYSLHLIRNKAFHNLNILLNSRHGAILDNSISYSWQTSDELLNLFTKQYNYDLLEMFGIGSCSGIELDPNDNIIQPKNLNDYQLTKLKMTESYIGKKYPDNGRYILTIAKKI
jgi:hypothetical protein